MGVYARGRDKEMAHSIQSTAVDVFSLPPPFFTNSTVVPLSASSGSFTRGGSPYVFPLSDPPIPLHTHTRHLKQGFWSWPIEALQSILYFLEGEGKKRRLLYFLQSEPSPYLWRGVVNSKKYSYTPIFLMKNIPLEV
jgi:hypothetical protein